MNTPRDPRSGRGPGSTPGAPQPQDGRGIPIARGTPVTPGAGAMRPPGQGVVPRASSQAPQAQPQAQQYAQPRPVSRQPIREPEPEPEPEMLDLEALLPLEDFPDPTAGGDQPAEAEPIPLDLDALEELDPEALYAAALAETGGGDTAEEGLLEPETLTPNALEPIVEERDDPPLMEGFENTRLDESSERRARKKDSDEPRRRRGPGAEFTHTACPACNTPQPQPAPAFCEACGTRLVKPNKKTAAAEAGPVRRCTECGFRNRGDKSNCTNCGSRLPALE